MSNYNPTTGDWNDSLRGDYLWSNSNLGEAVPDVMTPLTWSLLQIYSQETFGNPLPGHHPLMGNIGGRLYINVSVYVTVMQALEFSRKRMDYESEEYFGHLPAEVEVPLLGFPRWQLLRRFLLRQEVGEMDANRLLSGVSREGDPLASLGPVIGIWRVAHGEMTRETYLLEHGHRSPYEFEISIPRPAEDPEWMDTQLAALADVDVPALLAQQEAVRSAAWSHYETLYPRKAGQVERALEMAARAARGREAIRSEISRLFGVVRAFALQARTTIGLGGDVFYRLDSPLP